ncbi:MAG: phage major capsid protein [Dethiosulfatibacter sp.]|nr:phage major capsid protein [Dethiosulfatibacter sp.]
MEKILNNKIAERAKIANRVRKMLEEGITSENQANYDQAMDDFAKLTGQIEDLQRLSVTDNEPAIKVPDPIADKKTEFMNFVRFGEKPNIHNAVSTGTGSAGYFVPDEIRKEIIKILYETGAMMGLGQVFNTSMDQNIPVDGTAPTAYWISEEGAFTDSSPTIARVQLGANKVGAMIKVSEELLQDSDFNVQEYLTSLAGTALGRSCENEFINGTVSGRPTGFLGGATLGLTSSVTNSFNFNDLIDLYTAVKTPYAVKGTWLLGRAALGTVMKLTDGDGRYVYQPAMRAGEVDYMLSKPVKTSEYMPALTTTVKGVAFGDFSYYKIALRTGLTMQRLNELYAGNGQVGFRFQMRVDGKLGLAEAIKYIACK